MNVFEILNAMLNLPKVEESDVEPLHYHISLELIQSV